MTVSLRFDFRGKLQDTLTLSIKKFSIMTLSIKDLLMTLIMIILPLGWVSLCWVSHFIFCYDQWCYDECRYVECRYAECCYADCHNVECCYAECRYAEFLYVECRYAECHGGASSTAFQSNIRLGRTHQTETNALAYSKKFLIMNENFFIVVTFFLHCGFFYFIPRWYVHFCPNDQNSKDTLKNILELKDLYKVEFFSPFHYKNIRSLTEYSRSVIDIRNWQH